MTRIKFCGLQRADDIAVCNEVRPDFAGFILCRRFSRFCGGFHEIRKMLDKDIKAVGVFVDDPEEYVFEYVRSGLLDYVQLHGNEDETYIKSLKDLGIKVIKAFKVRDAEDIERAYRSSADIVLLDSGTGTGETFDWRLIKDLGRDYILAGGLTPENVHEAVRRYEPYAVDVSSGIERDRIKDAEKMRRFAYEVRRK